MNIPYILYFDGECIFCDSWIRLFYKLDTRKQFLFCALQAQMAERELGSQWTRELSTVIFQDKAKKKIYTKSSAILRALATAQPLLSPLLVLLLIPPSIRDSIYNLVAVNRYRIFGKKEMCSVDPSLDRSRFVIK